jgi:hypothetical protein
MGLNAAKEVAAQERPAVYLESLGPEKTSESAMVS